MLPVLLFSFLFPYFSFVTTLLAHVYIFIFNKAGIAYPFAAEGAQVKMHMRPQIGLLKDGAMFFRPQQCPCFLMLYGHSVCFKRRYRAFPFRAADVAEKTE
jgi:hypothetical protein